MRAAISLKKHEEDPMVSWALQTRAWVTSCALTIVRIILIVSNQGSWYTKEPSCLDG